MRIARPHAPAVNLMHQPVMVDDRYGVGLGFLHRLIQAHGGKVGLPRLKRPDIVRIVCDLCGGHDLPHMVESPVIERRIPPVRQNSPIRLSRRKPLHYAAHLIPFPSSSGEGSANFSQGKGRLAKSGENAAKLRRYMLMRRPCAD